MPKKNITIKKDYSTNLDEAESGYNKESGRKTLILIVSLIAIIVVLATFSVYLILQRTSIMTSSINSSSQNK